MRTTLGEQVRTYRLRRGLTQARLAHLIGRSERWLIDVERGGVDPRLSDALALARVLCVLVDDLVHPSTTTAAPTGRPPPRPPEQRGWRSPLLHPPTRLSSGGRPPCQWLWAFAGHLPTIGTIT
ncbi:MAG TPA: helix-turn-helix transcriptional regulator [Candidatus Dormibacteraeota bacterium]